MNLKVDSDMRLSSAFPTPFLFFSFYIFLWSRGGGGGDGGGGGGGDKTSLF